MQTEIPPLSDFAPVPIRQQPEYRAETYADRLLRRVGRQIREGRAHIAAYRLGMLQDRLLRVPSDHPGYKLARLAVDHVYDMEALAWAAADRDHELSHRLALARQALHSVEAELDRAVKVLR